jgi:5,10-methylenetetrahydromethanopterin reductase
MTDMEFWIASLGEEPHRRFIDFVRQCELLGYDGFTHADEKWTRDVYVRLGAAAAATDRIRLGITVTDPFTRHPALTAQAAATLNEAAGGRFRLYLGAGSHFETLPGYEVTRPAVAIEEMIELLRRLWAGERVTMEGDIVQFLAGKLDFAVEERHRPHIWVAGRGAQILRRAGAHADGVLIGSFANTGGVNYVKGLVEAGMEQVGRTWDDVGLGAWLYVSILDSEDEPVPDNIRRGVSHALWSSRRVVVDLLDDLADDISDELRRFMRDAPHEWSPDVMAELRSLIPRGLIDSLAMCGTVDQLVERFARLGELGVEQCVLWPFPREGEDVEDLATRLALEVFPRVRGPIDRGTYQLVD